MEVEIKGKKYQIRELKYLEGLQIAEKEEQGKAAMVKELIKVSAGLSDEEIEGLSFAEGASLQAEINKVNNLQDFQIPAVVSEQKQN